MVKSLVVTSINSPVDKKGCPIMKITLSPGLKFNTTKSTVIINDSSWTKTSSTTLSGLPSD